MADVRAQEPSSSTSRHTHQVFLSFRGEDTGKTFTSHLHTALVQAGFVTFRDDNEIGRGKKIEAELHKAIHESKISIIVFSKNYASSKWCLDELVMILQCRRTFGYAVLPVFYDVDPSQVRKQAESIGEAFARYEEQYKTEADHERKMEWMEKVKRWRIALKEVADLTGMVLQNLADGHESKFIQKIVKVVEDKLSRTVLHVAPYLVGIDSRAKNLNMWLQDGSANVDIFVIWGIGGIGKTTIAKHVYNSNYREFDCCIFLANIRESAREPKGLLRLQRQILSKIRKGGKAKIYNVDEATVRIKDAICSKKILVVLDDVDEGNQIDTLLGTREFYPGSKIIVTTRKRWLLNAYGVHRVDVVKNLYEDESLELFSFHAFGQNHPIERYMEQSKRVVQHCGGIPLAHKVLGSCLSGKSTEVWESAIEKLEAIPEADIQKKLKISYESLQDDHDKNVFLHIAFFFVGKAKDDTIKILDKCDFFTTVGIENLIDRCLITIVRDKLKDKLMVHQLLQEMGREIVRQESPTKPEIRSRLWHHKDSFKVLIEKTGTETIEGLILDMNKFNDTTSARSSFNVNNAKKRSIEEVIEKSLLSNQGTSSKRRYFSFFSWQSIDNDVKAEAFARMKRLKLLQLKYVPITGRYENFPGNLRWLCWHGFPLKAIPIDLCLENLVALDMHHSKLEQVWEGTKFHGSLKILNLSYSERLSRTPDFSKLPNLERLILKGCVSLVEVCKSVGNLKGLAFLNLKDCKNIRKFPNICELKSLQTLIISGCSSLEEFPTELRNIESLKMFHADGISITAGEIKSWHPFLWSRVSKPRKSPEMLCASLPSSLVRVSLADCNLSNASFPRECSNLSLLQSLNLSNNPICSLPDWVKCLGRLQELRLSSCSRLQTVLGLQNVDTLYVGECTSLARVTYQSTSFISTFLEHNNCRLHEIQGLYKLEPIGEFDTEMTNNLGLFNVESIRNLEVRIDEFYTKRPIQGLYEFGIFSTFLPGGEVPSSFSDKNRGSSISFSVPSFPNLRIRGLNVCSVYGLSDNEEIWYPRPLFTKINNKTKDLNWIYGPMWFGIPEAGEDLAWLSHWKFGNQLESGDEVDVSIVVGDGFQVKECGINLVFGEQEEDENQHNNTYLYSWKTVIGGDLSAFQLSTGAYFLYHRRFSVKYQDFIKKEDWTTTSWFRKLFGDSVEFTGGRVDLVWSKESVLVAGTDSNGINIGSCSEHKGVLEVVLIPSP